MAEFPTYEQMAKNVAEKALDEFLYDGKSIREWMKIIAEQEPCDDAVSRQAVLDTEYQIKEINGVEYVMLSEVQMKMRKLPSVRPQEQTGHWKFVCQHWRKCSECGFSHKFAEDWEYCPNCGAKMIEPTCDTCEYNTAAFMPCNACEDKSEYKPQESEVRNEHP